MERYSPPTRSDNSVVFYLHKNGPATADELPHSQIKNKTRDVVAKLKSPTAGRGGYKSGRPKRNAEVIYYLYGDERRAVRKYIEENTEYVRSCMDDNSSVLATQLDDVIWQMFVEEWEWGNWD